MEAKPIPDYVQPTLFDLPPDIEIATNGAARTRYGAAVQEVVCSLLRLVEIKNSGSFPVVFDAGCPVTKRFYEIKSVHEGNKAPIYVWRLEKERHHNPVYAFCLHRVRGASSLRQCYEMLSHDPLTVALVDHFNVRRMCEHLRVRQIVKEEKGTRMGYKRKGYCNGYVNIPVKTIVDACPRTIGVAEASLYGLSFMASVFATPEACEAFDDSRLDAPSVMKTMNSVFENALSCKN